MIEYLLAGVAGALVVGAMRRPRIVEVRRTRIVRSRPEGLHSIPGTTPRSPMRIRPAMRYSEQMDALVCPCGGYEDAKMRALRMEHRCSKERWV